MRPTTSLSCATALALAVALMAGCSGTASDAQSPRDSNDDSSAPVQPVPANPGSEGGDAGESASQEGADASQSAQTPSPSSTAETTQPEESQGADLDVGQVNDQQLEAVQAYLEVRENSESVRYQDVDEWKGALAETTTAAGLESALKQYRPAPTSNARTVARQQGYEVQVAVSDCIVPPGAEDGDDATTVQCKLTDLVITTDGAMVSSDAVDVTWPYYGKQESPTLALAKEDDKWLVDSDITGQAS